MPLRGRELPQDATPDGPPHHVPATLELLEEDLRVVVRGSQDGGDLTGRAPVVPPEHVDDGGLRRVDRAGNEPGLDLPEDVLEHLPRLPAVDPDGRVASGHRERGKPRDLLPRALLAVRPERGRRAAVGEGAPERAHVEPRLPRDLDLHGPSVDPAPVEGPRLPQGPEVPPALVAALELRGLRRDARGPRRFEVLHGLDHRPRVHGHPVLGPDRIEERLDGRQPAAAGHPRPLLPHGAEVLEETALADLEAHGVRVENLEPAHRLLAAPAPDVVRVREPGDVERLVGIELDGRTLLDSLQRRALSLRENLVAALNVVPAGAAWNGPVASSGIFWRRRARGSSSPLTDRR